MLCYMRLDSVMPCSLNPCDVVPDDPKQATGEVHVWLKEAKELCQLKSHNVDSFVKW